MTPARTLVAGIGNIFLGDDGFGVEVVRRLGSRALGDEVRVVDFGIRGLDLAYALLDGYGQVILVDAVARGGPAGTLYVMEPDLDQEPPATAGIAGHDLGPGPVLALVRAMGGTFGRVRLVGCEPLAIPGEDDDIQVGLSAPVAGAVDAAVAVIEELLAQDCGRQRSCTS
jgi:hydrogenase maturation protease